MKKPLIQRRGQYSGHRARERGVTLALVAAAIVAMLAMAALSIDVASLYLANAEAQRAADVAALAGARWLSVSGVTGDPTNSAGQWIQACNQAKQIAMGTAIQNNVGGTNLNTSQVAITVQDRGGNGCGSSGPVDFGLNPQVTVSVTRANLPLYFAPVMRAFFSPGASHSVTVAATATAEVFNPSNSLNFSSSGLPMTVAPRCVKPWIIPNLDPNPHPGHPLGSPFVSTVDGSIVSDGLAAPFGTGVIGETFSLRADCNNGGGTCTLRNNPPKAVGTSLEYVPADITGPFVAVPSAATGSNFQEASAGCDVGTVYSCGTTAGANADLTINPGGAGGDTAIAVEALINSSAGPDVISTSVYPFQIQAGSANPLVVNGAISSNEVVSSSNSIVTVPILDNTNPLPGGANPSVTIVGFLQLFITGVNTANGHLNVTVLNVSGCGPAPVSQVGGTSPVPIRLVQ